MHSGFHNKELENLHKTDKILRIGLIRKKIISIKDL